MATTTLMKIERESVQNKSNYENGNKRACKNEKLLDGVTEIKGYCDLTGSNLENLCSVKKIRGDLVIPLFTKLKDLNDLQQLNGNIICNAENLEDTKSVIKKLNINPQALRNGVVTTRPWGIYSGEFYSLPIQPTDQLNRIQAEASYK